MKCDSKLDVGMQLRGVAWWSATMALFVFILDVRKEDGGVFAVHYGPELEEVYVVLLADPPPTFRAVCIYRRRTGLFIVQLAGQSDWPKLQDKVARTQKLQAGPTALMVRCAIRTMRPDKEEAFWKALIGQLSPEEQMWLQPQPEDVMDITMLVRMPFVAPLWEEAIPLAILMVVDLAVTAASDVPMSIGSPAKWTVGTGGESGSVSSMASTTGAVMTTAMATMAASSIRARYLVHTWHFFIGQFSDNIVFRRVGIFIYFFLICLFVCLFVSAKAFEPDITDQCPLHHGPLVAPPWR